MIIALNFIGVLFKEGGVETENFKPFKLLELKQVVLKGGAKKR